MEKIERSARCISENKEATTALVVLISLAMFALTLAVMVKVFTILGKTLVNTVKIQVAKLHFPHYLAGMKMR